MILTFQLFNLQTFQQSSMLFSPLLVLSPTSNAIYLLVRRLRLSPFQISIQVCWWQHQQRRRKHFLTTMDYRPWTIDHGLWTFL